MSPRNARPVSLLVLAGVPLLSGFGSVARTGTSIDSEGVGGWYPNIFEFPTDVCQNLNTAYKVIEDDNEWCGAYDFDACANAPGTADTGGRVLVKVASSTVTIFGTAVAYDVCAWDPDKDKCKMASYSYYCHTSCPNVAQDRARSASSANVKLVTTAGSMAVFPPGGLASDTSHEVVTVMTQEMRVGLRRLEVSKPPKKPLKRRKLQAGCLPMLNGDSCCVGEFPLTDPFFGEEEIQPGPRAEDPDIITVGTAGVEGDQVTQTQYCDLKEMGTPTEECVCEIRDSLPIANDICFAASAGGMPTVWGASGARRLRRR